MTETQQDHTSHISARTVPEMKCPDDQGSDTSEFVSDHTGNVISTRAHVAEVAEQPRFKIETYTSVDITPELISEVADFYRYIFANSFGTYLFYPSEGVAISPQEVFDVSPDTYISLEQLDGFSPEHFPIHSQTGEQALLWMDLQKTYQCLWEKLKEHGHLSILRDITSDKIMGIIFGHICSIREEFETEEWENPHHYSLLESDQFYRSFDQYFHAVQKAFEQHRWKFPEFDAELSPDTQIYSWNTIATDPAIRGNPQVLEMSKIFFDTIPEKIKNSLLVIGETPFQSRAHKMFRTSGALDVPEAFREQFWGNLKNAGIKKDDSIIIMLPLNDFADTFSLSPRDFVKKSKAVQQAESHVPHTMDNPKAILQPIEGKGHGVFAHEHIDRGDIIAVFDGIIYQAEKLSDLNDSFLIDHVIQIGESSYLYHERGLSEYLNHSCAPNCGVRNGPDNTIEIVTRRAVQVGEELTWDYETSEDSDWEMNNCQCGSDACRGTIRAYRYLPNVVKQQYLNEGLVLDWLRQKYHNQ